MEKHGCPGAAGPGQSSLPPSANRNGPGRRSRRKAISPKRPPTSIARTSISSYCTLTASEDGRITRKSIEPGSYVQVGQSLFAIVPPEYWVVANFKETQLDRSRPGQPVNITIDAYPEKQFTGKIDSIQSGTGSRFSVLPAENATGNYVKVVQRVPAKIVFDRGQTSDATRPLAPGMSAVPVVTVK